MGIENGDHFIFTDKPDEKIIGSGYESLVHRMGADWVYKEVNPLDLGGHEKSLESLERARSKETVLNTLKEQQRMEEIFGEDHFLRSYYVYGENMQNKKEYMLIQKFIPGKTLDKLVSGDEKEYDSFEELVFQNREQFKDLLWATKKAFVEFGAPLDFDLKNFMKDDRTGNILLIDCGSPSEDNRRFSDPKISMHLPEEMVNGLFSRIERIDKIEKIIQLSDEEKEILDQKYGISNESVHKRIEEMQTKLEERDNAILEERRQVVGGFLDTVLKGKDSVTGDEIVDAALKVMRGADIPKETQLMIDKLRVQANKMENKEYWLEQIVNP